MCTIIKHNNTSLAYITVSWISCMFVGCCFVGCNNLYSNINGKCVVGLWNNVSESYKRELEIIRKVNRYDLYQRNPCLCLLDWSYFFEINHLNWIPYYDFKLLHTYSDSKWVQLRCTYRQLWYVKSFILLYRNITSTYTLTHTHV